MSLLCARLRIALALAASLGLATACARRATLDPSRPQAPPSGGVSLPVPPIGEALPAQLANGWPVWVTRDDEGRVWVVDAVVAGPPGRLGLDRELVVWIPGTRRFVGGGLVYDHRGVALGHRAFDACMDECPRIEDMPKEGRDLDTYRVPPSAPKDDQQPRAIGVRVPGPTHALAPSFVDYRRANATQEDSAALLEPPFPPVALADALAEPVGRFAVVLADVVRTTADEPRLCQHVADGCVACEAEAPLLRGVASLQGQDGAFRERTQGTFLVQREADGLRVVAGTRTGECGTGL